VIYLTKKNGLVLLCLGILPVLLAAASSQAASPVIVRHDAHIMEKDIRINIAWQSDEPIVRIIVSAGKEQVIVREGIDNDRNEGGYSGEIDIVVPALATHLGEKSLYLSQQNSSQAQPSSVEMHANTTSSYAEVVQFSVQLVDEVNQRSTLLKDQAQRLDPVYATANSKPLQGSQQSQQSSLKSVTFDTKDPLNTALNTTIGLIGKFGANPEIRDAKVNIWADNRVSINFDVIDDKGVDKVTFEVRDATGNTAHQDSVPCASGKQCNKQTDPFVLAPGKYVLSAVASDADNNTSKKVTVEFQVANPGQQTRPQTPNPGGTAPVSQKGAPDAPATPDSDDDPVVTVPGL
jgi:hypothetical protein